MAEPSGRAAVLGRPIGHSLSPVLHRAAYAALELDWSYSAIECGEADLVQVLAKHSDYIGFSCTMPLKRAVLEVADTVSARAAAIGAGNTLIRRGAGWRAENTDWIGVRDCLAEHGLTAGGRVLILGAGGTAQAVLAALPVTAEITVGVRDAGRTSDLRATARRLKLDLTLRRLDDLPPSDLVISTLPRGAADELSVPIPAAALDVIYAGWPTPFAARLIAAGAHVVSGASMLLHQAAAQVELMTGRAAPVPAMRAALQVALPHSGV